MLVQWTDKQPEEAGLYFLKLPDRTPMFVRLSEKGTVTHVYGGLLVQMSRQHFDAAQWSEAITFAPWRTGHSS